MTDQTLSPGVITAGGLFSYSMGTQVQQTYAAMYTKYTLMASPITGTGITDSAKTAIAGNGAAVREARGIGRLNGRKQSMRSIAVGISARGDE